MRVSRVLVATVLVAAAVPRVATGATGARARLTPTMTEFQLYEGQSRSLDYALALPAEAPRPTDVYLLVDTGPSMQPYLPAVRRGIAAALPSMVERGVGLGVGEFRTTSATDWTAGTTYRALRPVGPIGAGVAGAVDRLGRDQAAVSVPGPAAHPVALDEAVTGDGYRPYVAPGQQAGFRPGLRKVVVVVTDGAFATDPAQPSRADAIATLRAAGVEVFGLALHKDALPDLSAVAAGTGSLAETSVDCGASRIAAGRPAACVVAPQAIGAAVGGLLYERRPARLTVAAKGSGVRRLAPRSWVVDRNAAARRTFRLDFGCAAGGGGRTHEIALTASLSGSLVAKGYVIVRCQRRP